jgi:hypothetical protein
MSGGRLLLAATLTGAVPVEAAPPPGTRVVGQEEIASAMAESQGYNLLATTNGARLQSEVLLRLARRAQGSDPARTPLFVGHRAWFLAYLQRTGLTADQAPIFVKLGDQHGQDIVLDYRREKVLGKAASPEPRLALNVCIWWPRTAGSPGSYSYEDTLSTPRLKVTNERVLTYRLLDYGDLTVFHEVEGLRGRPTTGILGVLFQVIGEGGVVESRMALAQDGLQVSWARVAKLMIKVAATVTVYPDGRTEKDVPPSRPDLRALAARVKQPLEFTHPPLECGR